MVGKMGLWGVRALRVGKERARARQWHRISLLALLRAIAFGSKTCATYTGSNLALDLVRLVGWSCGTAWRGDGRERDGAPLRFGRGALFFER